MKNVPQARKDVAVSTRDPVSHRALQWSGPGWRRRHAITALHFAVESDGPTTSSTLNVDDAAKRLGANLPYVLAVEHVVAEERGLWRVFRPAEK